VPTRVGLNKSLSLILFAWE